MRAYFRKMKGVSKAPPCACCMEIIWSWVGSFLGILVVALVNEMVLEGTGLLMIIGSFGASAVLIYGAVESPLAQPRNLVGGHVLSAVVGVAAYKLLPEAPWLGAPLAVATAIALMHATRTLHPPGGATALIAVLGGSDIHALGWFYVLIPAATGSLLLLLIALVVNNIPSSRRYPIFWI
ncbi:MAG: HPP family protein [Desulfovibrionales bacterium]